MYKYFQKFKKYQIILLEQLDYSFLRITQMISIYSVAIFYLNVFYLFNTQLFSNPNI